MLRYPWEHGDERDVVVPLATSPLPADHFLSRRAAPPSPEPAVIAELDPRPWNQRAKPDTSSLAAADYDVSVHTGFMPPEEPVQRLRVGADWDQFEQCLDQAQMMVKTLNGGGVGRLPDTWRQNVCDVSLFVWQTAFAS